MARTASKSRAAIEKRKDDHLRLALTELQIGNEVRWWDAVTLPHCALPEMALDDVQLRVKYPCGTLGFPLMVLGMTGGTAQAARANQAVARVCARLGLPMGLGSMRPWFESGGRSAGYALRAPGLRLYGNVGGTQLAKWHVAGELARVLDSVEALGLTAFCVHLNPAQELMQPEGDRDFRGVLAAIEALVALLPIPVIVKETGAGISPAVARSLWAVAVRWIDISGSGGTSWTQIENARSDNPMAMFDQWGIPAPQALAACVAGAPGPHYIASGGIRHGLDVVRALSLGARMAGIARPVLSAWEAGGEAAVEHYLQQVMHQARVATLLTGSCCAGDLAKLGVRVG